MRLSGRLLLCLLLHASCQQTDINTDSSSQPQQQAEVKAENPEICEATTATTATTDTSFSTPDTSATATDTATTATESGTITRQLDASEYHILLDDPSTVYVEYKRTNFLSDSCLSPSQQQQTTTTTTTTATNKQLDVSKPIPVQKAFSVLKIHYKAKDNNNNNNNDNGNNTRNVLEESENGEYNRSLSYHKHPALFVMLNGQNHGVFISYVPGQLHTIAQTAGAALGVSQKDLSYPLRFFDISGRSLDFSSTTNTQETICDDSLASIQREKKMLHTAHFFVHLLLEKELFVWPGISLGFEWTIAGSKLHTLALQPKVILAEQFIPEKLCDATITGADSAFSRSPEKHYSAGFDNYRTSQTASTSAAISRRFQTRAAIIGRLPNMRFVESLQLLKYDPRNGEQPGQWYKSHHDFYHQYDKSPAQVRERILQLDHGSSFRENATFKARYIEPNRFLTFFPYLNNVEEGGETVFPQAVVYEKAKNPVPDRLGMPECSKGLSIVPSKGAAALFYAMQPDGSRDYSSQHGGCPPERGVKHAANLFTWNYEIGTISPIVFG